MTKKIIFIAGAPGTGKSTIANLLQKRLESPCFEFGWIPEFRKKDQKTGISYVQEEAIAFENLTLVLKNYIKHGFSNIIVTDLEDKRIKELHKYFKNVNYSLITFVTTDDEILKARVLDKSRSSKYRDWKKAIQINQEITKRALLPQEQRIDITGKTIRQVMNLILEIR